MDIKINERRACEVGFRTTYKIKKIRDGVCVQQEEFDNIVLNQTWTNDNSIIFTMAAVPRPRNIRIGTGTGTISASRTSLFNQISSINAVLGETSREDLSTPDRIRKGSRVYNAEVPASVVAVITEVGFGASGLLLTHAMIQDSNGNPISIDKQLGELLQIECTVHCSVKYAQPFKPWYSLDDDIFFNAILSLTDSVGGGSGIIGQEIIASKRAGDMAVPPQLFIRRANSVIEKINRRFVGTTPTVTDTMQFNNGLGHYYVLCGTLESTFSPHILNGLFFYTDLPNYDILPP
jgi:hypothetical protein